MLGRWIRDSAISGIRRRSQPLLHAFAAGRTGLLDFRSLRFPSPGALRASAAGRGRGNGSFPRQVFPAGGRRDLSRGGPCRPRSRSGPSSISIAARRSEVRQLSAARCEPQVRMRLPVAGTTALLSAGSIGGTPDAPTSADAPPPSPRAARTAERGRPPRPPRRCRALSTA
jgi:hypothetical protein